MSVDHRRGWLVTFLACAAGGIGCLARAHAQPTTRPAIDIEQLDLDGLTQELAPPPMSAEDRVKAQRLLDDLAAYEAERKFPRMGRDQAGKLTSIWLNSQFATSENVRLLCCCPDLVSVKISCAGERITPAALASLRRLEHLNHLTLRAAPSNFTRLHGWAVDCLSKLKSLELLDTRVERDAFCWIERSRISALRINAASFTDENVQSLIYLRELSYLDLSGTEVTDNALRTLAKLPKLDYVNVKGTAITTAGVHNAPLRATVHVDGAEKPEEAKPF